MTEQYSMVDELAEAAKADRAIMPALWEAVERFIRLQAKRRYTLNGGSFGGCEVEDLIQSGYIALAEAVDDYEPGRGSFISLLSFHLKTAFAEAAGIRSAKRDALLYADSLNVALDDDEPDTEKIDIIPDPAAEASFQDAEDRAFTKDLNKALRMAINALPPRKREIINEKYLQGIRTKQIAKKLGVSENRVYQQEHEALRQMRKDAKKTGLEQFVELHTSYYKHYSIDYMKHTGSSPTEAIFFTRERLREFWEGETKFTVIQ